MSEEYKLELLSFTGGQNYFQISLYSPKFRVNLPLVSEGDAVKLECYKLMIFLVTYAAIKGYRYVQANNHVKRKRIINEEYNRLSEEKVLINKTLNEVATLSN